MMISSSRKWQPPIDVYEEGDHMVVKVEIAGMQPDQFEILFNNNILTLKGCRQDQSSGKKSFHQLEIGYGEFQSNITFNVPVQIDLSSATYSDGFLMIRIPKSTPKKIIINRGDQ